MCIRDRINIILDPIRIFGFGLGVQGAAIATVLSQAVGAAGFIISLPWLDASLFRFVS